MAKRKPGFSVDTQLFRELGELLVGRESTALTELVKNAYDADARSILVEGLHLNDPDNGRIVIVDNGTGMTSEAFVDGFLRIATRLKSKGDRRTTVFKRRFTGEKGVGRLALHKLARHVEIESFAWSGNSPTANKLPATESGLLARIDWDVIEGHETLDEIAGGTGVTIEEAKADKETPAGTTITMTRLRRAWSEQDVLRFHNDVATLVPPRALLEEVPSSVLSSPLLFSEPRVRDVKGQNRQHSNIEKDGRAKDSFELTLLGDLEFGETFQSEQAANADWILEIDCSADEDRVDYHVAPTKKVLKTYPNSEAFAFSLPFESDQPRISFQARIFQRSNGIWPSRFSGVRVYMEGFRVLPYGEVGNDWLNLAFHYSFRAGRELLPRLGTKYDDLFAGVKGESGVIQANQAYFGGVFLTHAGAPQLHMLVNREGFLPGRALDSIRDRINLGLDMLVRVRYAHTSEVKRERAKERTRQRTAAGEADVRESPTSWSASQELSVLNDGLREARTALAAGDAVRATQALENMGAPLTHVREVVEEIGADAAMFRVLASIGTELAAFSHEINGLLEMAVGLVRQLERLRRRSNLPGNIRASLREVAETAQDLRQFLERQASFLVDIASVDAKRRRSRQTAVNRFEAASRLIQHSAEKRKITIVCEIPTDAKTPPMFPSEVTAVFTNLLTNAVKFAGDGGRVRAWAEQDEEGLRIRIENTGEPVDLESAENWFAPFRSTTINVDATLGQGMGLGLTITRSILDEYGALIRFVEPSTGYATALEILFPE